jgi:hypothetical protein
VTAVRGSDDGTFAVDVAWYFARYADAQMRSFRAPGYQAAVDYAKRVADAQGTEIVSLWMRVWDSKGAV